MRKKRSEIVLHFSFSMIEDEQFSVAFRNPSKPRDLTGIKVRCTLALFCQESDVRESERILRSATPRRQFIPGYKIVLIYIYRSTFHGILFKLIFILLQSFFELHESKRRGLVSLELSWRGSSAALKQYIYAIL